MRVDSLMLPERAIAQTQGIGAVEQSLCVRCGPLLRAGFLRHARGSAPHVGGRTPGFTGHLQKYNLTADDVVKVNYDIYIEVAPFQKQ